MGHLSEKRKRGKDARDTCGEALLKAIAAGTYSPIAESDVAQLEQQDREQRTAAWRIGRSTPVAAFSCKRSRVRGMPDAALVEAEARQPAAKRSRVAIACFPCPAKRRRIYGKQSVDSGSSTHVQT